MKKIFKIIIIAVFAAAFFGCTFPDELDWSLDSATLWGDYVDITYVINNYGANNVSEVTLDLEIDTTGGTYYATTDPVDILAGDWGYGYAWSVFINGQGINSIQVTGISWYPEDDSWDW